MGKTSIEWTDASWNPIVGCTEISPGCANCYAARLAATRLKNTPQYKGLAILQNGRGGFTPPADGEINSPLHTGAARWTGDLNFLPERLEEPLHWRKPRRIFVCDMGDLFHEDIDFAWIGDIWRKMAECPQHTFQVLTKRPARMLQFLTQAERYRKTGITPDPLFDRWPLPNVWLGVSVENQHFADERIPLLLQTPAALRWISAEPLLGLTRVRRWFRHPVEDGPRIDWVVCGGESGPNARPMHPDWARSLRDQCHAASVPFFFKQWGSWLPCGQRHAPSAKYPKHALPFAAFNLLAGHSGCELVRVGKKAAGRLLDGREWNEFPK